MKQNEKAALVKLLGGLGFLSLMVGIFTSVGFMNGLLVAFAFWILSGVAATYLGVEKKKKKKR